MGGEGGRCYGCPGQASVPGAEAGRRGRAFARRGSGGWARTERGARRPEEADGYDEHPPQERTPQQADEAGDVEREYAVAEDADGLEEGDVPSQ